MKLNTIEISGYTRFVPSLIKRIQIDFVALAQIILGTNGSGKSSLMELLTPLPPASNLFFPGGFVRLELYHRGRNYTTISTFNKKGEHEFWVGGENLNGSGNESEQRKLVKEHFGITPHLHQVLIGKIKFTQMKGPERRDFLMMLSGIDFDYVMSVFKQVKEHHRDSLGQYKGYVLRENDEIEKRRAIRSPEEIQTELARAQSEVAELAGRLADCGRPTDHTAELERIKIALNKTLEELRIARPRKLGPIAHLTDRDSVVHYISEMKTTISMTRKQMSELSALKQKIDELTALSITDENTLLRVQQKRIDLVHRRDVQMSKFETFSFDDYAPQSQAVRHGPDMIGRISLMVAEYPDNTEGKFTSEKISAAKNELAQLDHRLSQLRVTLELKRQSVAQYEGAETINCPKCDHAFKPHSNVRIYEADRAALPAILAEGKSLKEARDEVQGYLNEVDAFLQLRQNLYGLMSSYSFCAGLSEHIKRAEKSGTNAATLSALCVLWLHHLESVDNILELDKSIALADTAIERAKAILEQPQLELHAPGELEEKLNACLVRVRSCETGIVQAQQYLDHLDRHTFLINSFKENLAKFKDRFDDTEKYLVKSTYASFQSDLQEQIEQLEREMNGSQLADSMCERFKQLRIESEAQVKAGKRLLELLGPTEGLIAEYLYPFLQAFVNELNSFIQSIWTTDMTILPCAMDKVELDYKFPVRIGADERDRPDVCDMSSAQRDVVNFAFRFLVLHTLGFHDYPLYIDELDPSYDETHRVNAINYVKRYVLSNSCSQLFMISHYVSNHSIFTHADFIVLNRQNLVNMPLSFNQHVKVEELVG